MALIVFTLFRQMVKSIQPYHVFLLTRLQIFTTFFQSNQELESLNKGHSQEKKKYFSLATRKIPHNDDARVDHQLCKSGYLESRCQLTLHESVLVLK